MGGFSPFPRFDTEKTVVLGQGGKGISEEAKVTQALVDLSLDYAFLLRARWSPGNVDPNCCPMSLFSWLAFRPNRA